MKKITTSLLMILLFSSFLNAQNNFKELWLKVEKFEVEGLPKSALEIVDEIYEKADATKNSPQIIKTLFYKSKFALTLEENAQLKIIDGFKKQISKSDFPTKNVLENVLANLYWQYFTQNRYQFYRRTKVATTDEKNDDFRTWDLDTLFKEIHCYFDASLQNEEELQKIDIATFEDILQINNESKIYKPTLFDFLANNALQFYKTSETTITTPSYQFKIDAYAYLGDSFTFSNLKITSKDSFSLQLNALKVYQKLIAFHLKEKNYNAVAEIDIQRLNFVKQHTTYENSENIILTNLIASTDQYRNHEASALYAFEIANFYREQANSNAAKDSIYRFKNKEAISICNQIIDKFPNSLGAKKCAILKGQIEEKTLSIVAEEYIPIDTNSRLLVTYTNVEKLFFTGYKINQVQLSEFHKIYKLDEKKAFISKLEKTSNWHQQLRNEEDYLQHTTEVIVPKFKNGLYLIVASESEDLQVNQIYGTTSIQVTNLTLIENNFENQYNYQIVDRNTGNPIKNAEIHLKNTNNHDDDVINKKLKTDKKGFASFKSKNQYRNVAISVNTKNDFASFGTHYFYKNDNYSYQNNDKDIVLKPFIFTDRSIYRPGQTVYFKAIVIKKQDEKSAIFTNEFVEITLYDANNQAVKSLDLKLNEFGSIAGSFTLPNNGLTGEFSIEVEESTKHDSKFYDNANFDFDYDNKAHFSVEEYKRPKFETDFKPVTKSLKLNDSVTINGFAKAFSGANITDAKVVYRVHRKVQYPSWYYWYRPNPSSSSQEITSGESITDALGNFNITFKALADESVSKESLPIFTYEITADVTDVNGETRNATTSVKVGYHSLLATISLDEKLDKNSSENKITIDTKNLNDEFVAATGTLKIYKLKAPKSPQRKRPWPAPDYQDILENEFRKLFPNEAYTNEENDAQKWEKGAQVFSINFDTSTSKEIILKNIDHWISGTYIVVLESKDKFNQEVKDEKRVTLFSSKENEIADNQLFTINTNKSIYTIDDVVELKISSASENITVVVQIEKNHTIVETCLVKLNNNSKTIKIPVNKEDLGGFAIKYHFVNYNYFESGSLLISVPEKQENIEISTNIFRDKLQPGQDETWSFAIKDDKNNAIAAEVLASMYDASLDQFSAHNWQFNPIIPKQSYYSYNVSRANKSFDNTYFDIRNIERKYIGFPTIDNDNYNWFGFSFNNNKWVNQQYLRETKREINSARTDFDGTITGFIADKNGNPLPGVNVVIKGTSFVTTSDFDGNYSIKIKTGDVLVITYLGFESQEIQINKQTNIDLQLVESAQHLDEVVVTGFGLQKEKALMNSAKMLEGKAAGLLMNEKENADSILAENKKQIKIDKELSQIKARKNFNETAFFFPQLKTDENGNVSFNFTMPEALTKWKLQLIAYNKELKSATKTLHSVTQKELMVVPNAPRFLREKDTITVSAKITNLTNNQLNGVAKLFLTDAISGKEIDIDLQNTNNTKNFVVDANGNANVSWQISIPETVQAVQYKIVAKAGDFSDGEQNVLPVLSNRILVTESLPMWIRANETKTFTLDKLKNRTSSTLKNHQLTLEMTSNPVWYAIQSLPYLMEYPYECAEQTFSRFYANTLASFVSNSNPKIQEVFNSWASSDALLSNLEKNEELKSLIIQETPWLRDAQSESEQKKQIALLFDISKMKNEQEKAINKLQEIQMSSGGFPWFKGSKYENTFITQHIAIGFGHLQKLGVKNIDDSTKNMIEKTVKYLDKKLVDYYNDLIDDAKKSSFNTKTQKRDEKAYEAFLKKNNLNYFVIQYLYMRSFYSNIYLDKLPKIAMEYYKNQSKEYWNEYNLYAKGQIALSLFRSDEKEIANKILKSLKENSITSDELGMYWKNNTSGYYYYQAPIETQALMIETFSEIENDVATIDNLKIWLLKNKQTNSWKTTKATTEAVYALLLNGSDWIGANTEQSNNVTEMVAIKIGNQEINPTKMENVKVEAGTGYFKTSWKADEIEPKMAEITINKKGNGIAWGGLYWQYFEDLDKITSAETALKINKKLFLKVNSDTGKELKEINKNTKLKIGDLITVRIELRSDRELEFIHMKDMRASGVEPSNVLSQYKWQDNLGYYESTKDAATNFFFDRIPKGVYVFEYDVRVNNAGNFSNGITTLQSMYAPEFSSHSKGLRITILDK